MDNQINMKEVSYCIISLKKELSCYEDYVSGRLKSIVSELARILSDVSMDIRKNIMNKIREQIMEGRCYVNVYLYSFLLYMVHEEQDLVNCYQCIEESSSFSVHTKYYLYYQLKILMFSHAELDTDQARIAKWKLFQRIYDEFRKKVTVDLSYIPEKNRNEDLVVIIVEQFLSDRLGPTRTALERAAAVIRVWRKQALLINTAEAASSVGEIDFFNGKEGGYLEEWKQLDSITWDGVQIPFSQCSQNMPDIEVEERLLSQIRQLAPMYVLTLGGSSLAANLANEMIPVLTIGLGFSELEPTQTMFQSLARNITESDWKLLAAVGIPKEHIIETKFTFDLKSSSKMLTKKEFGIPEDTFIIVVAGTRLDVEITGEFLQMLDDVCMDGEYFIVFAGVFDMYQERIGAYKHLVMQSTFCGYQNDMLAFLGLCDLFVNPIRKGCGTLGIEAMSKGIPVVTMPYGDVSVDAGEEFWVKDYREMLAEIKHYCEDQKYYGEKSELAKKTAEKLINDKSVFVDLLEEYKRRMHRVDSSEQHIVKKENEKMDKEKELLTYACEKFENGEYDAALEAFVLAYTKGYEREWILQNIYDCYMAGNIEEFKHAYEQWDVAEKAAYEDCMLDFIPYKDGEYYIYDKEACVFWGIFSYRSLQETEPDEVFKSIEFSAVALTLDWDLRKMESILTTAIDRKIYIICNDARRCMSFWKIPELKPYLKNIRVFLDYEEYQAYFHENTSVYLPMIFRGSKEEQERLIRIREEEHAYRLTPEGRDNSNVLLTVAIPTANRGHLLLKRMENLLRMSYDAEIEIAISRNGMLYEEEYKQVGKIQDARLNYYDHGKELYCVNNWHYVVEMSCGKYVLIMSDEDELIIDELEHYLKLLSNNPELSMVRPRSTCMYSQLTERKYGKKGWEAFKVVFLRQSHFPGMIVRRKDFIEADLLKLERYQDKNLYYTYYPHEWWCVALSQRGDCLMEPVVLCDDSRPLDTESRKKELERKGYDDFPWKTYQVRIEQFLGEVEFLNSVMKLDDEEKMYEMMRRAINKTMHFFIITRETGYNSQNYEEMIEQFIETGIEVVNDSGVTKEHKVALLRYLQGCCNELYLCHLKQNNKESGIENN